MHVIDLPFAVLRKAVCWICCSSPLGVSLELQNVGIGISYGHLRHVVFWNLLGWRTTIGLFRKRYHARPPRVPICFQPRYYYSLLDDLTRFVNNTPNLSSRLKPMFGLTFGVWLTIQAQAIERRQVQKRRKAEGTLGARTAWLEYCGARLV